MSIRNHFPFNLKSAAGAAGWILLLLAAPAAAQEPPGPGLVLDGYPALTPGEPVRVTIDFHRHGHAITALGFSLDLDLAQLGFDPADGDEDGVPDAARFPVGSPSLTFVQFDAGDGDGELDVLLADISGQPLADGLRLELEFSPAVGGRVADFVRFSTDPPPSFGNAQGQDVPGTAVVTTEGLGEAPEAAFSFFPASPREGEPVQFTDGSEGDVTSCSWDLGDGTVTAERNPAHAYAAAGDYTVTLEVTNAAGSDTVSRVVSVLPAGTGCLPGTETACLLDGKFEVVGTMKDFAAPPREYANRVMNFPEGRAESDQAVFFHSFNPGNFEVGVKMVDACGLAGDHPLRAFWAFFGGLTNAGTEIEIEDTVTGGVVAWRNPAGEFPLTLGDVGAFACAEGAPAVPCLRDAHTACLLNRRFRVTGTMEDFSDPPAEYPVAVMDFPAGGRAESAQAVFFESFSPGNFEIGVKMVDGCGLPEGHPLRFYWAFYGGLTNAETEVRVTQIATGRLDVWRNPAGVFPLTVGRTQAFPCD